jgi:uncharacterized damage-inducible protein DinB
MNEQALFTQFWEQESATTRRVLERIPEGSDYKPDPRSRTAFEIAWQIVCEEKILIDGLETGTLTWTPDPTPPTVAAMLEIYDKQRADVIARLKALPAEKWEGTATFGPAARPASALAWSFLFDIVHHRGQISTYLRAMGSTVPRIYGPSGDES